MQTSLLGCLIAFLVILILLERTASIKIFMRLCFSLGILYGYIRAVSNGKSIILFSSLAVLALSFVNIFIKNGVHKKSFSELFSVLMTTMITSGIVWVICKNVQPKIFQDEMMRFNGIKKAENAIFGVTMMGTLGIFMDIISRIIFRLDEQKEKTVDTPWKVQFKEGIEIGKVFIVEKINMIILILLGVSLFPICLNINNGKSFTEILGQPEIFGYSLIAIVANIGLLLSVLITSCIYACFNRKKTIYKTVSENKVDGKRSLKL